MAYLASLAHHQPHLHDRLERYDDKMEHCDTMVSNNVVGMMSMAQMLHVEHIQLTSYRRISLLVPVMSMNMNGTVLNTMVLSILCHHHMKNLIQILAFHRFPCCRPHGMLVHCIPLTELRSLSMEQNNHS